MMRLAIVALALLVAGCASPGTGPTASEREAVEINTALTASGRQSQQCADDIERSPEFQRLSNRMALGRQPTEILALRSKPTEADIPDLMAVHRQLSACRAATIQRDAVIHPVFVAAAAQTFTEADVDFAKLIRREISWGQYASLSLERYARFQERSRAASEKVTANLAASSKAEARRTAEKALDTWATVQRTSLPNFTTCTYVPGGVTCTSY